MPVILLVHGAWHGSWCWANVLFPLQRGGVNAVVMDLPGRAGDPTPAAALTLDRYAEAVSAVAALQERPVVAVAHSMAGVVITRAAELHPELFAKRIYVCAFLPRDGESLLGLAGTEEGPVLEHLQADVPPGRFSLAEGAPVREIFYHDCPEEDARRAEALLVPEPMAPATTPVALTRERSGRVPIAYVECTEDRAVPVALQRRMAAAAECAERYSLDTGHSPFFAAPGELARILTAAAGGTP